METFPKTGKSVNFSNSSFYCVTAQGKNGANISETLRWWC